MSELIDKLQEALKNGGAVSAEVQRLLADITAQTPEDTAVAEGMVIGSRIAESRQPQSTTSQADSSSWLSSKTLVPLLGGLGIGSGAGAGISSYWEQIQKLKLPNVETEAAFFAIIAVFGALVGLGHSLYRNKMILLLPDLPREGKGFRVKSFGFVGNMFAASLIAMATTWMAFSAEKSKVSKDAPQTVTEETTDEKPNLLTWNVLLSAFVAALVGSRMASGDLEVSALMDALAKGAGKPADAALQAKLESTVQPLRAAAMVTGEHRSAVALTGTAAQAANLAPQTGKIQKELLREFDRLELKKNLQRLARPLTNDPTGLTMSSLESFQIWTPALKNVFKNHLITTVANTSLSDFSAEADKRGVGSANFTEIFTEIIAQSGRVIELMKSLPTDWSLNTDRI